MLGLFFMSNNFKNHKLQVQIGPKIRSKNK